MKQFKITFANWNTGDNEEEIVEALTPEEALESFEQGTPKCGDPYTIYSIKEL